MAIQQDPSLIYTHNFSELQWTKIFQNCLISIAISISIFVAWEQSPRQPSCTEIESEKSICFYIIPESTQADLYKLQIAAYLKKFTVGAI